jgi:ATP-dependent Clp protease ATP-binding subunit ClpC
MTIFGRLVVRAVGGASYLIFAAATAVFLFSEIRWIFWLGVLLGSFLIDRLVHIHDGERLLAELPERGRVNVRRCLSPAAFAVLEKAYDRCLITKHAYYLEVAKQLAGATEVREGLTRLDIKPDEFHHKLDGLLEQGTASPEKIARLHEQVGALAVAAFAEAAGNGHRFIAVGDLCAALPRMPDELLQRLFTAFDIAPDDLGQSLLFGELNRQFRGFRRLPTVLGGMFFESQHGRRHRIMNRAWTSRPTPVLDRYSTDFTDLARQCEVGFLIGHDDEYTLLRDTLARPVNPNALLVGEAGIGKETLVTHLARDLVKDRVPPALFDKRLVALELPALVAGSTPEELQDRIKNIVDEILVAGNVILYIPDIHNLVRTSGTAYLSAADALMPIILNNAFPVIGATYPKEFKQFIEPRSDFAGAFDIIRVQEITEVEARRLLIYESLLLERQTKIMISFGTVKAAVRLAKKYVRTKFLPSSAEELLKAGLVAAERRGEKFLGPDTVIAVTEEKVHIPIHEAAGEEAQALLSLEATIHERLIDQEEAVKAVADALREYRSGLVRSGGPIACFLFVGPTGVGKTELSKVLARLEFGSEKAMVRFDMTEYQDKQSFYRFIGSPDGTVNGALTDAILQKPYSLILLDEFEKAFPDILTLFLQVFDDARLTDDLGRTVDFSNTIIIATSNAHSDIVNEALSQGETMAQIADYLKKKLVDFFKPELLNRFSRIVVFKNLGADDVQRIARLNLQDLGAAVAEHGITLEFDPTVVEFVAKRGYEPAFGARPLQRVIDDLIRAPLAERLLRREFPRGSRVRATVEGDAVSFTNAGSGPPAALGAAT